MTKLRHDWRRDEIEALLTSPFNDLLCTAQHVHRQHFDPNAVQVSTLVSIKTGACPEDCKYCPQSGHYDTGLAREKLMRLERVLDQARKAKATGATRFCMGAAWKHPSERDMPSVIEMVKGVRALGLETCMTLGRLDAGQARALAAAGLDYYNHNLDTSAEFYPSIITTRTYAERLETLGHVRDAGMKICCGGILGMGESVNDRAGLLQQLANLPVHPESVPVNLLIKVEGTPLEHAEELDPFDFVRTLATARILMPRSHLRLSAGREQMSDELQALAFHAGANSIFYGERLLTTKNPQQSRDQRLFERLGLHREPGQECDDEPLDLALGDTLDALKARAASR